MPLNHLDDDTADLRAGCESEFEFHCEFFMPLAREADENEHL